LKLTPKIKLAAVMILIIITMTILTAANDFGVDNSNLPKINSLEIVSSSGGGSNVTINNITNNFINESANYTLINLSIDNKISTYNLSWWSYLTNLINSLGNWSADKSDYNTSTEIIEYVEWVNTTNVANQSGLIKNYNATGWIYNQSNKIGDCPKGYVVQNTTLGGVECISISTITYYPNSSSVTGGSYTDRENITDAWYYDEYWHNFTEGGGANPLDVYFNFSNVTGFSQLITREYYLGSSSHYIQVQIWDYDDSDWEDYFEFVGQNGMTVISIPVFDDSEHISPGGNVSVRFHHIENGITSHKLYFDFIWLVDGNNIGSSTNLDGYARYNFGFNNFAGSGNFTGRYLNITTGMISNGTDWFSLTELNSSLTNHPTELNQNVNTTGNPTFVNATVNYINFNSGGYTNGSWYVGVRFP